MTDDNTLELIRRGQEALCRLKSNETWENWKCVGFAIDAGQHDVLRKLDINRPVGRRYNERWGKWLRNYGFHDENGLDKSVRSKLLLLIHNITAIEKWRELLEPWQRMKWNSPDALWEHWPDRPKKPKAKRRETIREAAAALQEELDETERELVGANKTIAGQDRLIKSLGRERFPGWMKPSDGRRHLCCERGGYLLPLGTSGTTGRHGRKLLSSGYETLLGLRRYHRQRTKCPLRARDRRGRNSRRTCRGQERRAMRLPAAMANRDGTLIQDRNKSG